MFTVGNLYAVPTSLKKYSWRAISLITLNVTGYQESTVLGI
jgi:hypothetical protein